MILKQSPSYWTTGIILAWHPEREAWSGKLNYLDDGWAGDDNPDTGDISTEGTLRTRYALTNGQHQTALTAVIDALVADATRLGIQLGAPWTAPWLYVEGDGEHTDVPLPADWRELLATEARRIGWSSYDVRVQR